MGSNLVWCGICAKYLAFGTYTTWVLLTKQNKTKKILTKPYPLRHHTPP